MGGRRFPLRVGYWRGETNPDEDPKQEGPSRPLTIALGSGQPGKQTLEAPV
jgi:hypothetical protein